MRISAEQPAVQVEREEQQRGEDLGREGLEHRAVEEVPEGALGQQVTEMVEVVVHPPEPEDRAVEQRRRPGERQRESRLGRGATGRGTRFGKHGGSVPSLRGIARLSRPGGLIGGRTAPAAFLERPILNTPYRYTQAIDGST